VNEGGRLRGVQGEGRVEAQCCRGSERWTIQGGVGRREIGVGLNVEGLVTGVEGDGRD